MIVRHNSIIKEEETPNEMKDFFISYSTLDEAWAEWIAWELESVGYDIMLQKWDFTPGKNLLHLIW